MMSCVYKLQISAFLLRNRKITRDKTRAAIFLAGLFPAQLSFFLLSVVMCLVSRACNIFPLAFLLNGFRELGPAR
jgi:hypothetical protein